LNLSRFTGALAALWGATGVLALLSYAVARLTPVAIQTFEFPLTSLHWIALLLFVVFMAYSEGYKGFQLKFSPRVAARCLYLSQHPTLLRLVLAPLFCMGFFHTTRRRQIVTICVTLAIFGLVQVVYLVNQPWRGIIDFGVVVGLVWGSASLIYFLAQAFTNKAFNHSAEMP
jgi:hypothetical protein